MLYLRWNSHALLKTGNTTFIGTALTFLEAQHCLFSIHSVRTHQSWKKLNKNHVVTIKTSKSLLVSPLRPRGQWKCGEPSSYISSVSVPDNYSKEAALYGIKIFINELWSWSIFLLIFKLFMTIDTSLRMLCWINLLTNYYELFQWMTLKIRI